MRNWFSQWRRPFRIASPIRRPSQRPGLELLEDRSLLSGNYLQTNLVSNVDGMAAHTDALLTNSWGLAYGPTSPFWVSDNTSGKSTLYDGQGDPFPPPGPTSQPLQVTIPGATAGATGSPTGTVFNTAGSGFSVSETTGTTTKTGSSVFLFATLDGTISGWSPSVDRNNAIIAEHDANASYTGLAFGTDSIGRNLLYAADFAEGTIDVFNSSFQATTVSGGFIDHQLPRGYSPFNIQNLGGHLFVAYAQMDPHNPGEDLPGPGHGVIDEFNSDGVLQMRLVTHGPLSSPWGMALAPSNFGAFSNDLLVGNNGNGMINAFNPHTGALVGTMKDAQGNPIVINDLWALKFGNGGTAGPTNTLFFTGILTGSQFTEENSGLFGSLQAIPSAAVSRPLLPNLTTPPPQNFSTVPANGDLNPYGVAFVPGNIATGGKLHPGDILVSNFNNSNNEQGTGTTIVDIGPQGQHSVFFQGVGLGLTTALGVLRSGFVLVGNVPTTDGTSATVGQGSLLILDSNGNQVASLTDPNLLDGPWDLAVNDQGSKAQVYVSNVLNGTVTRIDLNIPRGGNPTVKDEVKIASGYQFRTDPDALVVGPTGLAYDAGHDLLYVASTGDNGIFVISHASKATDTGKGKEITTDAVPLHGPLGLLIAPNGNLIVSNGDAVNPDPNHFSELTEITPQGNFVAQFQVDPNAGAAFGIAASFANGVLRFAAVDDATNTLEVWTFTQGSSSQSLDLPNNGMSHGLMNRF